MRGLDRLTDRQRQGVVEAVDSYRGLGYRGINHYLRAGEPTRGAKTIVANIDRGMEQSPLPSDIAVFRSLKPAEAGPFGPRDSWPADFTGREWTDLAYSSTTTEREILAKQDDAAIAMRLTVPAGTHAIKLSDVESEVLLERGLTFRVVKDHGPVEITDGWGRRHTFDHYLDVEVIPSPTPAVAGTPTSPVPTTKLRPIAEALTLLDEFVANGSSPRAIEHRLRTQGRQGLPPTLVDELTQAGTSGDPARVEAVISRVAAENGLHRISGPTGSVQSFNRRFHQPVGGDIPDGALVRIIRPGYEADVDGKRVLVHRAVVQHEGPAMKASPADVSAQLANIAEKPLEGDPEAEATTYLDSLNLSLAQLRQLARDLRVPLRGGTKTRIRDDIVMTLVGRRVSARTVERT